MNNIGVVINLTSNYIKGISKSNVVLNLDFPIELLNKCVFSKYALIINFENNIKIYSKSFEGINVNFYKIVIPLKYRKVSNNLSNFSEEVLYESFIYSKRRYEFIREQIISDKLRVRELLGVKGKIKFDEFLRVKKLQNINQKNKKIT